MRTFTRIAVVNRGEATRRLTHAGRELSAERTLVGGCAPASGDRALHRTGARACWPRRPVRSPLALRWPAWRRSPPMVAPSPRSPRARQPILDGLDLILRWYGKTPPPGPGRAGRAGQVQPAHAQPGFTGTVLAVPSVRCSAGGPAPPPTRTSAWSAGLLALLRAALRAQIRGLHVTGIDSRRHTLILAGRPFPTPGAPGRAGSPPTPAPARTDMRSKQSPAQSVTRPQGS